MVNKDKLAVATAVIATVGELVLSDNGKKFLCGSYSDGSPRSLRDALSDEYVSPEDRDKRNLKKEKIKNKKSKKSKSKKKNKSNRNNMWL